ncbi:trypsin-like peptidase domain-containing protein [Brevundimonas sp.]|uniref:trypsin-like peptidase domain-containing protein n=1 Tax=Brevundimonas sp. TaxID=1871086 RepID=UPI002FC6E951
MRDLKIGERLDIASGVHEIRLAAGDRDLDRPANLVIVPVNDQGETIDGFGPLASDDRADRPGLTWRDKSRITLDLLALPTTVERLIFILYLTDAAGYGDTLARAGALSLQIDEAVTFRINMSGRDDTATIMVEIYRRQNSWRVSANGQGFAFGISAVSRALKIQLPISDGYSGARVDGPSNEYGDRGHQGPPSGAGSSGSAFAISPRLLLTNHHVIEDAVSITASGASGTSVCELVVADPLNDIALLRIRHDSAEIARFRPDTDVDLGEDVIAAGFPLQGLLGSGPQVSVGNVSSLMGIGNNSGILQFNAPIGSGSSGGPILDNSGLVVGLVKAVLRNDLHHAPIAQNVNFGVKSSLVRSFLHSAGASPTFGDVRSSRSRSDIARDARAYLYLINVRH